jgi:hypothetical protein
MTTKRVNGYIAERIKRFLLVAALILLGLLFMPSAKAQSFHDSKAKHFKSIFRKQIRQNDRVCNILAKKRTKDVKRPSLALKSVPKYKPQAEVDSPISARLNRQTVAQSNKTVPIQGGL